MILAKLKRMWLGLFKQSAQESPIQEFSYKEFLQSPHVHGKIKDQKELLGELVMAGRYKYLAKQTTITSPFVAAVREFERSAIAGLPLNRAIENAEATWKAWQ